MPGITNLPCEIVASILRNLDNVRFLTPTLLACRHFYSSYKESPGIELEILRRQIPSALFPESVALMEVSRLPHPYTASSIRPLLKDLYQEPDQMSNEIGSLPLPSILRIGYNHDIIHSLVMEFAKDAWELLSQDRQEMLSDFSLSSTEYVRFCRAFYRADLLLCLLRGGKHKYRNEFETTLNLDFFYHPPWEDEQLGCVHDFLEKRFSQASRDVVAHDIDFGEYDTNYLSLGPENRWKQDSLSRGLQFIHQVMNEVSYSSKKELLRSTVDYKPISLHDAITASYVADDNDEPLEEYSNDEIQAMLRRSRDRNDGPFVAWRSVHREDPRDSWVLTLETAGLRERAYVLWDNDRIERYKLLELYESVPEDPSHTFDEDEFDRMQESFEERSQIWRKGGRGDWSPNDTSRVVWPSSHHQTMYESDRK
ncbi:hypothetical protein EDB80DRAFT_628843 [Ilyonectria destructans]|nr:hypothetical protein EDB80DRAFT_628843 [Ilyonectria destructans]